MAPWRRALRELELEVDDAAAGFLEQALAVGGIETGALAEWVGVAIP